MATPSGQPQATTPGVGHGHQDIRPAEDLGAWHGPWHGPSPIGPGRDGESMGKKEETMGKTCGNPMMM